MNSDLYCHRVFAIQFHLKPSTGTLENDIPEVFDHRPDLVRTRLKTVFLQYLLIFWAGLFESRLTLTQG